MGVAGRGLHLSSPRTPPAPSVGAGSLPRQASGPGAGQRPHGHCRPAWCLGREVSSTVRCRTHEGSLVWAPLHLAVGPAQLSGTSVASASIGLWHGRGRWGGRSLPVLVVGGLGPGPRWPALPSLPQRTWRRQDGRAWRRLSRAAVAGLRGGGPAGAQRLPRPAGAWVAEAGPLWPQCRCHGDQRAAMGDEMGFDRQDGGSGQQTGLQMDAFPGQNGRPATWRRVCDLATGVRPPRPAGCSPRGSVPGAFRGLCLASWSSDRWWPFG